LTLELNSSTFNVVARKNTKGVDHMRTMTPKITLEAARVNAGYTLKEAAELLGISVATLHKWEKDSSSIKVSQVKKIEEVYEFPCEHIFFGIN